MSRRSVDRDTLLAEPLPRDAALRAARHLLAELPSARRHVGVLVALTLAEVAVQVVVALSSRKLLIVVTGEGEEFPVLPAVVAAVAAGITFVVVRARHRHQERMAIRGRERAVRRLAHHMHAADVEDLSATPMAGLREVLMTDVDFAYRFLLDAISQLTVLLAWLVAAIALTAWLSLPLLGVLVLLGTVITVTLVRATRRHLALTGPRFTRLAESSQRARDVVEVERAVMARQFGLRGLFADRFLEAHEEFTAVAHRQGMVTAAVRAWFSSLGAIMFLAVVVTGGVLVLDQDLSVGSLVAVLFVLTQLLAAVVALGDFGARLAESATATTRLMAFWEEPTQAESAQPPPEQHDPVTVVAGEQLRFGYAGGQEILDRADLTLRRGRMAALTASTGAGKSTLALLLTGVLTPHAGHVSCRTDAGWTGTPSGLQPGRMLYLGSKPILMAGTIRDNLLLDHDHRSIGEHELRRLLAEATAGALPFGLDEPVVGPNGTGLSSGQAQLVQLVRAVCRDPDVIVFDEATSALDIETEAAVQQALLDWCARRVTLVVSHRTCPWTEAAAERWGLTALPGSPALTTVPPGVRA